VTTRAQILRLVALAACLTAVACGSDDGGEPIPAEQAQALQAQLDSIQDRFDNGDGACRDITEGDDTNTAAVESILDSIPENVDPEVRDALRQSFERLFQLTSDQCVEVPQQTDTTPTDTTPTDTTPTDTTPTDTTPTDTTPTETTPTDTTPTDTTPTDTQPGADQQQSDDSGGVGSPEGDG
jgi:cell division septation protein DedD